METPDEQIDQELLEQLHRVRAARGSIDVRRLSSELRKLCEILDRLDLVEPLAVPII